MPSTQRRISLPTLYCIALLLVALTVGCGDSGGEDGDDPRSLMENNGGTSTNNATTGTTGTTSPGELCSNGTPKLEDGTCLGEWACPEGWEPAEDGLGCAPPPLAQACAEGTFAVPGGQGCSEPWACPEGWERVDDGGIGCKAPPMRQDCPEGAFAIPGPDGCSEPWTCPDGWQRMEDGPGCAPTPSLDCPDASIATLTGQCTPLGLDACGDTPFGDHAWPDTTVFVDINANTNGDGSREAPINNLIEAITRAGQRNPAVIALAPGTYTLIGLPQLRNIDQLGGACADSVTVNVAFNVTHDVTLHDLTLRPSNADPLTVTNGAHLTLERTHIAAQRDGPSVVVNANARLTAERVRIDGSDQASGVVADGGARVECARCLIERTVSGAVAAFDDAEVDLSDSEIRSNRAPDDDPAAYALYARDTGSITARDVLLRDNAHGGARLDDDASLTLTRVALIDTAAAPPSDTIHAVVDASDAANATLEDVIIDGAGGVGVFAHGDATVQATRLVIARIAPTPTEGSLGSGVLTFDQSAVRLEHTSVYDTAGGALVASADSSIEGHHAWISRVAPNGFGWTYGARSENTSRVAFYDSAVVDIDGVAISEVHAGGSVRLERVRLDRINDHPTQRGFNAALSATGGGELTLRDVSVARFSQRALVISDPNTRVDAERLSITDAVLGDDALNINDARLTPLSSFARAHMDLRDVWIDRAPETLLAVLDQSTARVERFTGRRNLATNASAMRRPSASSAIAALGSTLEGQHIDLSDIDGRGIDVYTGVATLSDVRVDTVRNTAGYGGFGVYASNRGELTLTRAAISRTAGDAVLADGASTVRANALHVHDLPYDLASSGTGASVYSASLLELEDARFDRCGLATVLAHTGATARVTRTRSDTISTFDMVVAGQATLDVADHYATRGDGFGFVAVDANLTLERAVIRERAALDPSIGNVAAGLGSFNGATLQATDLIIAGNAIDGVQAMTGEIGLTRTLVQGNARGLVRLLSGTITQTQTLIAGNAVDDTTCESVCVDGPGEIETATAPATPSF